MSGLGYTLLIVLSFVLEAKVRVLGIMPSVSTLIVYSIGLRNGHLKGLAFGALIGIVSDSLSGGMLGPNLLGKGVAGYFSASLTGLLFFRWTPFIGIIGAGTATIIDRAVSFISISIFHGMSTSVLHALYFILGQAVLNSVVGLFIRPKGND